MVSQKPASTPSFTKELPAHTDSVKTCPHTLVQQKPASLYYTLYCWVFFPHRVCGPWAVFFFLYRACGPLRIFLHSSCMIDVTKKICATAVSAELSPGSVYWTTQKICYRRIRRSLTYFSKTSHHTLVQRKPASTGWFSKSQPAHPGSVKTTQHIMVQ